MVDTVFIDKEQGFMARDAEELKVIGSETVEWEFLDCFE